MAIGAAFGFAAGLAVGAPGCVFECPASLGPPENQDFSWSDAMVGAALLTPMLAGFGTAIDALIRRKRTIYLPAARPTFSWSRMCYRLGAELSSQSACVSLSVDARRDRPHESNVLGGVIRCHGRAENLHGEINCRGVAVKGALRKQVERRSEIDSAEGYHGICLLRPRGTEGPASRISARGPRGLGRVDRARLRIINPSVTPPSNENPPKDEEDP